MENDIARALLEGFDQNPKRLPSWMFYDSEGDKIFQEIMRMPEYYLTDCEYQILKNNKEKLLKYFNGSNFELVELGAGDGVKTEILLQHLKVNSVEFTYRPVDISWHVLRQLRSRLTKKIPDLDIKPLNNEYHEALEKLKTKTAKRKVLLFLGANIGNFGFEEAITFIQDLKRNLNDNDLMVIGFDMKKDPRVIRKAYDDPHGITSRFNLNLLKRLNSELAANFNLEKFLHYPYYNPDTGTAKSFLVSREDQAVNFNSLGRAYDFKKWEVIHTEVSQKYDEKMLYTISEKSGLKILDILTDDREYFCDVVFEIN